MPARGKTYRPLDCLSGENQAGEASDPGGARWPHGGTVTHEGTVTPGASWHEHPSSRMSIQRSAATAPPTTFPNTLLQHQIYIFNF